MGRPSRKATRCSLCHVTISSRSAATSEVGSSPFSPFLSLSQSLSLSPLHFPFPPPIPSAFSFSLSRSLSLFPIPRPFCILKTRRGYSEGSERTKKDQGSSCPAPQAGETKADVDDGKTRQSRGKTGKSQEERREIRREKLGEEKSGEVLDPYPSPLCRGGLFP